MPGRFLSLTSITAAMFLTNVPCAGQNLVKDANYARYGERPKSASGSWGTGLYHTAGKISFGTAKATFRRLNLRTRSGPPGQRPRGCFTGLRIVNNSAAAPHVYKTTAQRVKLSRRTGLYRISLWARSTSGKRGSCFITVDSKWKVRPLVLPGGFYNWNHFTGHIDLEKVDTVKRGYLDLRIVSQDKCKVDITRVQLRRVTTARARLVHALLVIDTDSNLKSSVEADQRRFLRSITRVFQGRMSLTQLTGRRATPSNILAYYQTLRVDPNDTLLFFYAGHGGIHRTFGHSFTMTHGHISRRAVLSAMQRKGPRLKVLLTDCCSNLYGKTLMAEVPYVPDLRIWHDLLLRPRGTIDITSASPGESAWGQAHGGFFTTDFYNLTTAPFKDLDKDRDGTLRWSEMLSRARRATQATYRRFRESSLRNASTPASLRQLLRKQRQQTPYAFQLKTYRSRFLQIGAEPQFVKGRELFNNKKYAESLVALGRAIAENPTNYRAYNYRGRCFRRLADNATAIADFSKSIALNPRYSSAFNNRALTYEAIGRLNLAAPDYVQAANLNRKQADYQRNAAWILATCKVSSVRNGKTAVSLARRGCKLTQWKNWRQLRTLAAAYAEAGQFDKAVTQIERAIKHAPKSKLKVLNRMRKLFRQNKPYRV